MPKFDVDYKLGTSDFRSLDEKRDYIKSVFCIICVQLSFDTASPGNFI
jgi:hypothetical protein